MKWTMVLLALAASTADTARVKQIEGNDADVEQANDQDKENAHKDKSKEKLVDGIKVDKIGKYICKEGQILARRTDLESVSKVSLQDCANLCDESFACTTFMYSGGLTGEVNKQVFSPYTVLDNKCTLLEDGDSWHNANSIMRTCMTKDTLVAIKLNAQLRAENIDLKKYLESEFDKQTDNLARLNLKEFGQLRREDAKLKGQIAELQTKIDP